VTSERAGDRVTIEHVAREADVSYATVSRVINSKGYVSEDTRERVMRAIEQTGYVVNRQARGLAGGKSQVVGLVLPDLDTTSYVGPIVRGIDEGLSAASYDLMLYTTHRRKNREAEFVANLTNGLTDGVLLVLATEIVTYLDSFRRRGFPYVLIEPEGAGIYGPSVGTTNHRGAYEATAYLIELGHRDIGFITGNMRMGSARERLDGFRAALTAAGISLDPELVQEGDYHQQLGYQGARALLARERPPTAIFASNDVSAFGVMEAVRDSGYRIGADISVLGFDDIPASAGVHPPLTTVRQPLVEMGVRAARMLINHINDPETPPERFELGTSLVIRESCQAPASR
jgi:LacI family transcriptional regulator